MQVASAQLDAARKGHKRAVAKLRDRVAAERQMEGRVDEGRHARLNARAQAVIALKESTEAASSAMRSSNARRQERLDEVAKQREEEKYAILAKGGNPYQVFRQRDEDAPSGARAQADEEELEANMTNLQERIIKDYQIEAKERATAEAPTRRSRRRRSPSRPLARSRPTCSMEQVTKKHVTVIDPTSKERHLHPSEHMTVKSRPDWKFGLGMGADPDIIDHIAAKYPDVTAEANVRAEEKRQAAKVALATGKSAAQNRPSTSRRRAVGQDYGARGVGQGGGGGRAPRGSSRRGCGRSGSRRTPTRTDVGGGGEPTQGAQGRLECLWRAQPLGAGEALPPKAAARKRPTRSSSRSWAARSGSGPPFLCKPAERSSPTLTSATRMSSSSR